MDGHPVPYFSIPQSCTVSITIGPIDLIETGLAALACTLGGYVLYTYYRKPSARDRVRGIKVKLQTLESAIQILGSRATTKVREDFDRALRLLHYFEVLFIGELESRDELIEDLEQDVLDLAIGVEIGLGEDGGRWKD